MDQDPEKPVPAGQVEQDSPAPGATHGRDVKPMTQEEASRPEEEAPAFPARGA